MTTKTDAEHWQQHQQLKKTNPHAAALYLNEHADSVYRGKPAETPAPTTELKLVAEVAARGAAKQLVQRTMQADTVALVAFRDYEATKAKSPHAAALLLNRDANNIIRGRELAAAATPDPDPEPPQAA